MTSNPSAGSPWADRAAARSPIVQRSRGRSAQQAMQIVDAAIELIDEKGSSFTIQELAKHARVALQTFYHHFAGKDELLLAVLERIISDSMVGFEARARKLRDPLSRLRFYVTVAISSLDDESQRASRRFMTAEHYRLHQLFPDELSDVNRIYTGLIIPEIRAAAELGQLAPNDIEADAWFITELVMATFHHYAFATSSAPTEQLSESLWRFCLVALGGVSKAAVAPTPRGRSTTEKRQPPKRASARKPRSSRPAQGQG
jgi:TetR/AcrR family transcriptional regulator